MDVAVPHQGGQMIRETRSFSDHTELRLCGVPGQRSKVQPFVWCLLIKFVQIIDRVKKGAVLIGPFDWKQEMHKRGLCCAVQNSGSAAVFGACVFSPCSSSADPLAEIITALKWRWWPHTGRRVTKILQPISQRETVSKLFVLIFKFIFLYFFVQRLDVELFKTCPCAFFPIPASFYGIKLSQNWF